MRTKTLVTFTGVDEKTDIGRLCDLQKRYPLAEFGVLYSRTKSGKNKRYPAPGLLDELTGRGLNLALHVCGSQVNEIAREGGVTRHEKIDYPVYHYTKGPDAPLFQRIQLNGLPDIHQRQSLQTEDFLSAPEGVEVILQSNSAGRHPETEITHLIGAFSVLVDLSRGRGVESPFELYRPGRPGLRVGYAGGINPENVMKKTAELDAIGARDYWIDMETGIRTDDWFDLDKVEEVLKKIFR